MIKSHSRKSSSSSVKRSSSRPKRGISSIAKSAKRYSKQTLRDLLLSKTFNKGFKVIIAVLVFGSALYGAYAFIGDSLAHEVVVSESEILERVGKHTELPEGKPEAIVRVQDPETLKAQNALYENVKEGDYIVMFPTLAVVYDLRNDHIVALKSLRR
jgi:hypothetical protein